MFSGSTQAHFPKKQVKIRYADSQEEKIKKACKKPALNNRKRKPEHPGSHNSPNESRKRKNRGATHHRYTRYPSRTCFATFTPTSCLFLTRTTFLWSFSMEPSVWENDFPPPSNRTVSPFFTGTEYFTTATLILS